MVLPRVGDEILVARKHLAAGYAPNAAFRAVYADVATQVSRVFESSAAQMTHVRPLPCVYSPVNYEVGVGSKSFLTMFTLKGFLTCVSSHVNLEHL